jgi:hypothetical protein
MRKRDYWKSLHNRLPGRSRQQAELGQTFTEFVLIFVALSFVGFYLLGQLNKDAIDRALKSNLAPLVKHAAEDKYNASY